MARPREFDEEQVLDAIMQTFWHYGYEHTSAQNLVDATGLGRGSLYAAYKNKEGLFEQALLHYRKCAQAQVEQLDQSTSAIAGLRQLMQDMVDADLYQDKKRGCLATNSAIEMAGRDASIAKLVRQNFGILQQGIENIIRLGQAQGEIRNNADAKTLALFVFNSIQGLRVMAKTTPVTERSQLISIIEQTLSILN